MAQGKYMDIHVKSPHPIRLKYLTLIKYENSQIHIALDNLKVVISILTPPISILQLSDLTSEYLIHITSIPGSEELFLLGG
ncbi:hypothetical protein K1719_029452 [Acacia pycnantha]|nr:hypothetical protein K1719_029452 [Acacia pycnantha]